MLLREFNVGLGSLDSRRLDSSERIIPRFVRNDDAAVLLTGKQRSYPFAAQIILQVNLSFLSHSTGAISGVDYTVVNREDQLPEFIRTIADSKLVGFDTEFVAEDCYRPDLCLLQVSTRDQVFIVDPRAGLDLSELWRLLAEPQRTVVVHAGREEILFVYRATGSVIPGLFDVQVAVGLLGGEYPASYGKVLQRILGESVAKGETRTDWRKRPLSRAQLDYAALDVLHLPLLYDRLKAQLEDQGRQRWLADELSRRQANLVTTQEQEGWMRISGVQSVRGNHLGAVRELWRWRDERAQAKDMPARRVLRDDLIIELAKRGLTDPRKIAQIRGLHHAGVQRLIPEMAKCIEHGMSTTPPAAPWLLPSRRSRTPALLQQFLTAAMSYLCRSHNIAPAIVGTSDDVGRLVSYWIADLELNESDEDFPNLLRGWRAEFVGEPLHDIFLGKRALRVQNPEDEMPLSLCRVDNNGDADSV